MHTNEREDKKKNSNRRLTQIYADKSFETRLRGFTRLYQRTSVFICGSSYLRFHLRLFSNSLRALCP
jgi:hypothetical protein